MQQNKGVYYLDTYIDIGQYSSVLIATIYVCKLNYEAPHEAVQAECKYMRSVGGIPLTKIWVYLECRKFSGFHRSNSFYKNLKFYRILNGALFSFAPENMPCFSTIYPASYYIWSGLLIFMIDGGPTWMERMRPENGAGFLCSCYCNCTEAVAIAPQDSKSTAQMCTTQ